MAWNADKTYMYLYRGAEPSFRQGLYGGGLEDIRDVEVSESLSYAISQIHKSPGRVIWQLRFPMDLFVRATTAPVVTPHDHNSGINWIIERSWLARSCKPGGVLIRQLNVDPYAALDQDQATFEP